MQMRKRKLSAHSKTLFIDSSATIQSRMPIRGPPIKCNIAKIESGHHKTMKNSHKQPKHTKIKVTFVHEEIQAITSPAAIAAAIRSHLKHHRSEDLKLLQKPWHEIGYRETTLNPKSPEDARRQAVSLRGT